MIRIAVQTPVERENFVAVTQRYPGRLANSLPYSGKPPIIDGIRKTRSGEQQAAQFSVQINSQVFQGSDMPGSSAIDA
jgi:hypothetical protein